jgi:hypothetical protein
MLNNIDLVTVTCTRDCGIQELQSYSLDLMVSKPCNHYVIVEDCKTDIEEWRSMLAPYYTRHRLHLIPGSSLLSPEYYINDSKKKNGWHRQQLCKLLIADKIQSEKYLILDSKNFFIHKQLLDDWPLNEGNGVLDDYDSLGWFGVDDFCFKHNIAIPKKVYNATTPFMVHTAIVKKIIEFDILPVFFNKKRIWSSEFFLYSIFTQHVGNKLKSEPVPNLTFWNSERQPNKETLKDIYTWPNLRTVGLHREVIEQGVDLTDFIDFLNTIGFDPTRVKSALKIYKQNIQT